MDEKTEHKNAVVGLATVAAEAALERDAAKAPTAPKDPAALAGRVAAAIIVANNPELAPFGSTIASAVEAVGRDAARRARLGWRRFLPWAK